MPAIVTSTPSKFDSTAAKFASTPARLMFETPVSRTPKRSLTRDDDASKLHFKSAKRRSLKFDEHGDEDKEIDVQVRNSAASKDLLSVLPENLLHSLMEKEQRILEEQDPIVSQARKRQQLMAGALKLIMVVDNHVSTWADGKTLPASYVLPPGRRPGDNVVPTIPNIPVIDLSKSQSSDRKEIVQQIIEAAEHFGFFQVINHGVPWRLMDDAIGVFKEFFELPLEEKSRICLEEQSRKFTLFTSSNDYDKETHHLWRDAARHSCTPLEECTQYWPSKPLTYREVVGNYVVNLRELGSRLLELISEGLGLEHGYFAKELSQEPVLVVNHYPPCPDPSLTLAAGKHCDPNLITILLQEDVPGLQFVNNGEWISVEPIPYAFVVNIGLQLQIISNGKLRSMEHRAVTNAVKSRTTSAYFIEPRKECFIEPAKAVLSAENPSNYKGVQYKELLKFTRAAFIE